jgi:hypothetical protein
VALSGSSILLLLALAASPRRPATASSQEVAAELVAAFANEVRTLAGPDWELRVEGQVISLSHTFSGQVPNAPGEQIERGTYRLVLTVSPFLDDEAQRARLTAALKHERGLWRGVEKLGCDGMEFSDHYIDGLCFRPRTEAQRKAESANRDARERPLKVPQHHRSDVFAVAMRGYDGEPTDARCGAACEAVAKKVASVLTDYPSRR